MDTNAAIILMLADRQREIETLRAELSALRQQVAERDALLGEQVET